MGADLTEFSPGHFAWYVTPIGTGGAIASVTILASSGSMIIYE